MSQPAAPERFSQLFSDRPAPSCGGVTQGSRAHHAAGVVFGPLGPTAAPATTFDTRPVVIGVDNVARIGERCGLLGHIGGRVCVTA